MAEELRVEPPGAVASMVCGIISIVVACLPIIPLVLGIVALSLANRAKNIIENSPERFKLGGIRTSGFVCGIIGTALGALYTVYFIIAVLVMGGSMLHVFR